MKTFLLICLLIFITCGCKTFNYENFHLEGAIIDLSKLVKFNSENDSLIIKNEKAISEITNHILNSSKKGLILIQSKHGERFLFNTHMFYGEQIKNHFANLGIPTSQITNKIGFDFGKIYGKEFSNSRAIIILR